MIVKEGKQWVLRTKDGAKILGRHETREGAQQQEWAINAAKRAKGER